MNFLESNELFNGHGILEKKLEDHSIVCQNERMVRNNLSVFTKSSFKNWLTYESNRPIIDEIQQEINDAPVEDFDQQVNNAFATLFSITEDYDLGNFSVWRNEGRSGRYINYESYSDWEYENAEGTTYRWSDVENNFALTGLTTSQGDIVPYLIALNKAIQEKFKLNENINDDEWLHQERAAYEFFTDVNSSKERCLSIKRKLNFKNQVIGKDSTNKAILQDAESTEIELEFKIYFFSVFNKRKVERKVGFRDLNIVSPKKDAIGQPYNIKESGLVFHSTNQQSPKEHAGASIDLKYTEFLNKWESGTPQIMAIMTVDLPAVQKPDLDLFVNGKAEEILHYQDGLEILRGSAIPLSMDQCNPLQWCPTYAVDERLRLQEDAAAGVEEDKTKTQIPVYNLSDTASFASGDIVVLNRIDGVWIPLPYSPSVVGPRPKSLLNWDFTYLMTNSDTYFRNEGDELISFEDFEKATHKSYYINDPLNKDTYGTDDTIVRDAAVSGNYFQVTSWDFMGPTIGGLRQNGNALGCTQFEFHPDGESVTNQGRDQLYVSGPFFGCVFPDGFPEDQKVATLKSQEKAFNIRPTGAKDSLDQFHEFFQEIPSTQDVFENRNTNRLESTKDGMFASNINQLPADIAMNSSPEGVFGRPISLTRTLPTGIFNLQDRFKQYFKNGESGVPNRYSWMYQHPTDADLTASDLENSAFDLRPQNIKKIQFRPLKTETYACFEIQSQNQVGKRSQQRGEFAEEMWDTQSDGENPISTRAKDRNLLDIPNTLYDSDKGLLYENSVSLSRPRSDFNPDLHWSRDWIGGVGAQGNAFGIIGAVCTVNYDSKIEFSMDSYIGMQPWFLSNFLYSSWNKGAYNQRHTTDLSVRSFHNWPREQTIYDSRYFAVHHFNKGLEKQESENGQLDALDQEEVDVSGVILDIDFLEVHTPSINKRVYSNTETFSSGVSTVRRGKLLPFNYQYKTIGIGPYVDIIPDNIPPENIDDPIGKIAQDSNILIKSSGANYSESDRFILQGGNGQDALLKPVLNGEHNGIIDLEIVHSGRNYLKSDFLEKGVVLNASTSSTISVRPSGEVSGIGLDAIVVGGTVVQTPVFTDKKPTEVFFREISPNPNTDGGVNAIADTNSSVSVKFGNDVLDSLKSSNDKYDLFFHFHNDISHTWHNGLGSQPASYEQKLDLTVNLDPDS